ncbi:MAG TPA: hypothetical protein VLE94_14725 [Burkholderiaceae bacterium]|nr:hypothetical protein [Burkholderiaceae bacterium]
MVAVVVACVASPSTAGIASAGAPPATGVSMQSAHPAVSRIAHGAAKSGGLLASCGGVAPPAMLRTTDVPYRGRVA